MIQFLDIVPNPPKVVAEAVNAGANSGAPSVGSDFTTVAVVCAALIVLGICLMVAGKIRKRRLAEN